MLFQHSMQLLWRGLLPGVQRSLLLRRRQPRTHGLPQPRLQSSTYEVIGSVLRPPPASYHPSLSRRVRLPASTSTFRLPDARSRGASRGAHTTAAVDRDRAAPLIPFVVHHVWLGGPLPEALARLRESWLSRHGGGDGEKKEKMGWELRLWTDADVAAFDLENRRAYEAAGNFGQKSDILRYEVRA